MIVAIKNNETIIISRHTKYFLFQHVSQESLSGFYIFYSIISLTFTYNFNYRI